MQLCVFRRSSRKRACALLLLISVKVIFFVALLEVYCFTKFETEQTGISTLPSLLNASLSTVINVKRNKTILIWNSPERIETAVFGFGHKPFVQHKCKVSDCILYKNKSAMPFENYDAIIVHMHVLWLSKLPDFPRRENQRFIFLTQESPAIMPIDVFNLGNIFNWTMSYRLNSDIQLLYGRIFPEPTAPKTEENMYKLIEKTHQPSARNYAANKIHLVVWMATHCDTPSLRETYVRQLKKFVPVDIYGGCGNLSCERNDSHWLSHPKCYDMIEAKYKFYLSFENSLCDDYVTEKFFYIMDRNVVPVVYGKANYSRIAPAHSYIDALQFTPEGLAHYLKVLDANDALYNEYFWWKGHYQVEAGVEHMARHGFCDLCNKLHQEEGIVKYYAELASDWHPQNKCISYPSWETAGTVNMQ